MAGPLLRLMKVLGNRCLEMEFGATAGDMQHNWLYRSLAVGKHGGWDKISM